MPDYNPNEETTKRLFTRWLKIRRRYVLIAIPLACIVGSSLLNWLDIMFPWSRWISRDISDCLCILTYAFIIRFASRFAVRCFIARLSQEEKEALAQISDTDRSKFTASTQKMIQSAQKYLPEYELLRASQQPQDDTLLRAAAYTDTVSQEQLLRSSLNENA